jgi:hypothetical protein
MLWCNHDILIRLSLPLEVKVEIALIRKNHLFSANFIHEELTKVKFARLIAHTFDLGLVSHYRVVDLVAFTLNVESEWTVFPFNVALEIVVVGELELRIELDLNWTVTVGRHHS